MNEFMQFLMENWYLIVVFIALVVVVVIGICKQMNVPTEEQLDKVREWLLWAVTEAERELGGGTGQLKLRQVYDLFIVRFPWLVKVISFSRFSDLVDDALVEMREMLSKNEAVQAHVGVSEDE